MAWSKNTDIETIREYNRKYYESKTKEKLKKERELNRKKKVCPICGTSFMPSAPREKYCCDACKLVATKIRTKLYRESDKAKETFKKYRQSETYKKVKEKYMKSEKGKNAVKRYLESAKGQAAVQRSREKAKEKAEKKSK